MNTGKSIKISKNAKTKSNKGFIKFLYIRQNKSEIAIISDLKYLNINFIIFSLIINCQR